MANIEPTRTDQSDVLVERANAISAQPITNRAVAKAIPVHRGAPLVSPTAHALSPVPRLTATMRHAVAANDNEIASKGKNLIMASISLVWH